MKVYFFETSEEDVRFLTELLPQAGISLGDCRFREDKLTAENAAEFQDAEAVSVFINSVVKQDVIDQLPALKFITTRSTGFDHIDTSYAASKGIQVANVPAYGSRTVAEFTFALMLGLTRKTFAAYRQVKEHHNFSIAGFEGFNLQGKTLGIVGTGRIGQNVAQIAKGFDMHVLGFDAYPNQEAAARLGFEYKPLNELLNQSDIITLHVPYNKDTHHLINRGNIGEFKKGSLLINTARGEVTETEAILQGLDEGILAGVGIDVIEGERQLIDEWHVVAGGSETAEQIKQLLEDHVLIHHEKVAYTPHIAFFTQEAKKEIVQTTVDNLSSFAAGSAKNTVKA